MTDGPDVRSTLAHFAQNIDKWREEVARLGAEGDAQATASTDLLVHIEEKSSALYQEIDSFNSTVAEIAKASPQAAAELAGVGEALHLLLLDFTELGTRLYSTRSADALPTS